MIEVKPADYENSWCLHVRPDGLAPQEVEAALAEVIESANRSQGQNSKPRIGLVICPEPFPDHQTWIGFVTTLIQAVSARYQRGELDAWLVGVATGKDTAQRLLVRAIGAVRRAAGYEFSLPIDLEERGHALSLFHHRGYLAA